MGSGPDGSNAGQALAGRDWYKHIEVSPTKCVGNFNTDPYERQAKLQYGRCSMGLKYRYS